MEKKIFLSLLDKIDGLIDALEMTQGLPGPIKGPLVLYFHH